MKNITLLQLQTFIYLKFSIIPTVKVWKSLQIEIKI